MTNSAASPASAPERPGSTQTTGLVLGISSFAVWGLLPLYLQTVKPTSTFEIIAWRIVLSVVFCFAVLLVARRWGAFMRIVKNWRSMLFLGLASLAVFANWTLYVLTVEVGRSLEGSLGYYLNPLISMLLGMVFLRERLRPLQWVAAALATASFIVMVVAYGEPPWLSLAIACSFAIYGLLKKQVSRSVDPIAGLTMETLWLAPVGIGILIFIEVTSGLTMGRVSGSHTTMLLLAGVMTSVPLLLFAAATARLSLVEVGIVQYVAPTMQFIFGVVLLHEPMPPERWLGFGLVWLGLVFFTIDLVIDVGRGRRRTRVEPDPTGEINVV